MKIAFGRLDFTSRLSIVALLAKKTATLLHGIIGSADHNLNVVKQATTVKIATGE